MKNRPKPVAPTSGPDEPPLGHGIHCFAGLLPHASRENDAETDFVGRLLREKNDPRVGEGVFTAYRPPSAAAGFA